VNAGPTLINHVDGRTPQAPIGGAIWIEPGQRRLSLSAPTPTGWPGGSRTVEHELNAEACNLYDVSARGENPLAPRFTAFIDSVDIAPGRTVPTAAVAPAKK